MRGLGQNIQLLTSLPLQRLTVIKPVFHLAFLGLPAPGSPVPSVPGPIHLGAPQVLSLLASLSHRHLPLISPLTLVPSTSFPHRHVPQVLSLTWLPSGPAAPCSCLTLSHFLPGGTMGIYLAQQLSLFSSPRPPLGLSWCARASANLVTLSCLS